MNEVKAFVNHWINSEKKSKILMPKAYKWDFLTLYQIRYILVKFINVDLKNFILHYKFQCVCRVTVTDLSKYCRGGCFLTLLTNHVTSDLAFDFDVWASAEEATGRCVSFPEFSYMIPLMCFSTSTRFVKASQLLSTILVLCCAGWR